MSSQAREILIINPSETAVLVLRRLLQSWGFQVQSVSSIKEALEFFKKEETAPDVVISEILTRKGEDSFSLPREIHQLTSSYKEVPVIAYSVLKDKKTIVKAIDSGYADYVVRPSDAEVLKEKIFNLFTSKNFLNDSTYRCPVREEGEIILKVVISKINEFGLELWSDQFLRPKSQIRLKSPLLTQLGVLSGKLQVLGCEQQEGPIAGLNYRSSLQFIGLSREAERELRRFAITDGKSIEKRIEEEAS